MSEVVLIVLLVLGLALVIGAVLYSERTFLTARIELERSWITLTHHQQAIIEELRNRLMTHSWESYHHLQTDTPQAQDRVSPRVLPDFPRPGAAPEEGLRDELEEALANADAGDLEGWRTTVG